MKRFLLSIIYLYLAGMLVAQTAPLEILPYPNEVKVHPGHYPFMSCQLVYPNALKNEADLLKTTVVRGTWTHRTTHQAGKYAIDFI